MAKKEKQKKQYDAKKHIQMTGSDRVMNGGFYLFITVFSIICLIPFLLVLGSSFTAERALTQNGYNIWPSEFSLDAYKLVFVSGDIPQAYLITVGTTIVGTFFSMVFTCGAAYAMSVKNFKSRGVLALFIYFTMLFNGGLVANYLLTTKFLHLQNNILVLLLPSFCNAWNILLMRNFFSGIPASLAESAKIDGANAAQIFFKITLPYIMFIMGPYIITQFTGNINNFNVIYLLSAGKPTPVGDSAGKTDLLVTWLYKLTIDNQEYNIGAVIGILTFIVLSIVALVTYRNTKSYKDEEGFM